MVQSFKKNSKIIFIFLLLIGVVLFLFFLPKVLSSHYVASQKAGVIEVVASTTPKVFVPSYVETPRPLKGIYMTSWIASSENTRAPLVKIIDETEINSVVIDVKDYSGKIVFPIGNNVELKKFGSEEVRIKDLQEFIEELHQKGIYVIARIAVFQDAYFVKQRPDLAVKNEKGTEIWKDRKGISWIDAGAREYWDYIVLLSKETRKVGFDEINFDYIRFPSDGNMKDISYPWSSTTPKHLVMKDFFEYLDKSLEGTGIVTSADLFGLTTTAKDDMGIGQLLENALPYFDYIMPMVYPSHYAVNFEGLANPEAHPYEVVKFSMQSAAVRAELLASTTASLKLRSTSTDDFVMEYKNKLRPWLQDFGLKMTYGATEVRAQIKATNDAGLDSWILWSPSNRYTRSALEQNPQN